MAVQESINKLNMEDNKFLEEMSKKYQIVTKFSKDLYLNEKDRLNELKKSTDEMKRQAALDIERARFWAPIKAYAAKEFNKFGTSEEPGTKEAATSGLGEFANKMGGGAVAEFARGNWAGGIIKGATALGSKFLQMQLVFADMRETAFNLQMAAGQGGKTAKGFNDYLQNMSLGAYQFGVTKKEMENVAKIASTGLARNIQELSQQAASNTGIFKTVRDASSSFGISMSDSQQMYNTVYNTHKRMNTAAASETKAMNDLAATNYFGKAVAKDGYMGMQEFAKQSTAVLDATSDYRMSLEEASSTIAAISRIQGPMAVKQGQAGQQAQNIIGAMQGMSPEMIMAMTGGGLGEAYNWPNTDKRKMTETYKGAFGGLGGGMGGSASEKMISLMWNKQMGMDDRTSRTLIEMPKTQSLTLDQQKSSKDEMTDNTKALLDTRGVIDKGVKLTDAIYNMLQNFLGGHGVPIPVKLQ